MNGEQPSEIRHEIVEQHSIETVNDVLLRNPSERPVRQLE